MIKKIYQFSTFSDDRRFIYKFIRDYFADSPGPQPFVLRKFSRTNEVVAEQRNIDEFTAGFILEKLLTGKHEVEIEYFSYSQSFRNALNK